MPARTIAELSPSESGIVTRIGGERAFRRRLMELGLVPGTSVVLCQVAPLGTPSSSRYGVAASPSAAETPRRSR